MHDLFVVADPADFCIHFRKCLSECTWQMIFWTVLELPC